MSNPFALKGIDVIRLPAFRSDDFLSERAEGSQSIQNLVKIIA